MQPRDPEGLTCPAAAPLCPCGARGCESYRRHVRQLTRKR